MKSELNAADLMDYLNTIGAMMEDRGDRLGISVSQEIPAEILEGLSAHKSEILNCLRRRKPVDATMHHGIIDAGRAAIRSTADAAETRPDTKELRRLVRTLFNTLDGCWEILDDGSRRDMSEREWRIRLHELFGR